MDGWMIDQFVQANLNDEYMTWSVRRGDVASAVELNASGPVDP